MDAKTGAVSIKGNRVAGAYEHSFGPLKSETRYYDPSVEVDMREELKSKMEMGIKALGTTTGGAGTAGYALIPVYVDPRIVDRSRKYTPLVEMIPRVTNQGLTADFNVVTAKGSAVTAAEDAALSEANDTYDRVSKPIKFLYSVGRVTGPAQAGMPSYIMEGFQPTGSGMSTGNPFTSSGAPNAKQTEVLMKARSMKELEENLILNGSVASDATQFDGIVIQQGTTNVTDLSAAALSWDDVESSVQAAYDDGGRPKIAVASSAVITDLRKIMLDTFRFSPKDIISSEGLPFGIPAQLTIQTMVGPIVVFPSMYLSNTSGAKQIYFLDTDFIEMRVLQDMTYEELAKTNDSQKFMLKIYECLILRAPSFNSFIDNIA